MKRFFMIGLVLLAYSLTQCGDMFNERNNRKMNDKIEGDWKITQVTYKRAHLGKPDSVVHEVATIRFTPNCADGTTPTDDYCSKYAYYTPANQPVEYEMRWNASYDMNKQKHLFNLRTSYSLNPFREKTDTLQLGYDGNWRISELTKKRLVATCDYREIVFTK
jgi:hypothetical protein